MGRKSGAKWRKRARRFVATDSGLDMIHALYRRIFGRRREFNCAVQAERRAQ